MQELEPILSSMTPISLEEMSAVKLMNRVDSKFPTNMGTLLRMAPLWNTHFYVQEVDGQRIARYRTLYFDTPDAVTYTMHHNRRLRRQKVRQRIYVDSGIAFCEIKNKKNTGRTKKKRIQIPMDQWGDLYQLPEMADFIREKVWVTDQPMSPRLENAFLRIQKHKFEKLTLDQLAADCHMSRSSFEKKFRIVFGSSPGQYLIDLKLAAAESLLRETSLTCAQIAERCGFSNQFLFSRLFSKRYRIPPRDYRNGRICC